MTRGSLKAEGRRMNRGAWAAIVMIGSVWLAAASGQAQNTDDFPELQPIRTEIPPTFWERRGQGLTLYSVEIVVWLAFSAWLLSRPQPKPAEPIEVVTRRQLEQLRAQPEDRATASAAARCVRNYFGAAFGLPALELTTEEFCRWLAGNEAVGAVLAERVTLFLRQGDAARFAATGFVNVRQMVQDATQLFEQGEARRREWQKMQLPNVVPVES